jgi:hypothetical protein
MKLHTTRPQAAWRSEPLFPVLPHTTSLEIYDLRSALSEIKLSVVSLVGLVNRGPARLYVLENDDDVFWLTQLDPAFPRQTSSVAPDVLLVHLLTAYREQVQGLVIYDPDLLDTINVATTLAALRDGLVVSPAQAEAFQAEPYHLPVLADLRTHGWKTRLQAYAWASQHLLPECSHEMVAGLNPNTSSYLRAFLVAHRVFIYWLDGRKRIPSLSLGGLCERGLFKRILASFQPGSVHLGWYIHEPSGVRLSSSSAILTFASDYCTNLEVWSNLSLPTQQVDPTPVKAPDQLTEADLFEKQDGQRTIYLSFTMSDGDNLQYCQHHMLYLWRDRARGSLPLGWTITPALPLIMPYQAAFYLKSASANDEFIVAPSGAGYILPSHWPVQHREGFLQLTARYMQDMPVKVLQVLDSNTLMGMKFLNPGLQKLFVERLAVHGLRGIFSGSGSSRPSWQLRAGLPVYQNLGLAINPQVASRLVTRAVARGTRYINIYVFAWKVTPGDLQGIVKQLGEHVVVVTPGRLLELIGREK